MPRAFITGILGQDGSYLAELLLEKGYEVHGFVRGKSLSPEEVEAREILGNRITIYEADLTDSKKLSGILNAVRPNEIYNFAASHDLTFENTALVIETNALAPWRMLETIRHMEPRPKFFQAGSSQVFGNPKEALQNESTSFAPVNPYGVAKLFAYWTVKNYRDNLGIFACNAILYNHESPRRPEQFVTRKITKGVAEILAGKRDTIRLGDLEARRDWAYAPNFVEAMWMMLQHDTPDDYVLATGELHSVREFVEEAFRLAGIKDWGRYVEFDPKLIRSRETVLLAGDATKAKEKLGWEPKMEFRELVRIMFDADCRRLGVHRKENAP